MGREVLTDYSYYKHLYNLYRYVFTRSSYTCHADTINDVFFTRVYSHLSVLRWVHASMATGNTDGLARTRKAQATAVVFWCTNSLELQKHSKLLINTHIPMHTSVILHHLVCDVYVLQP